MRDIAWRTLDVCLVAINALGIGWYLLSASKLWPSPGEKEAGAGAAFGDSFYWAFYILPIIAVFWLVDIGWQLTLKLKGRGKFPVYCLYSAVALWGAALLFDLLQW